MMAWMSLSGVKFGPCFSTPDPGNSLEAYTTPRALEMRGDASTVERLDDGDAVVETETNGALTATFAADAIILRSNCYMYNAIGKRRNPALHLYPG